MNTNNSSNINIGNNNVINNIQSAEEKNIIRLEKKVERTISKNAVLKHKFLRIIQSIILVTLLANIFTNLGSTVNEIQITLAIKTNFCISFIVGLITHPFPKAQRESKTLKWEAGDATESLVSFSAPCPEPYCDGTVYLTKTPDNLDTMYSEIGICSKSPLHHTFSVDNSQVIRKEKFHTKTVVTVSTD